MRSRRERRGPEAGKGHEPLLVDSDPSGSHRGFENSTKTTNARKSKEADAYAVAGEGLEPSTSRL